jgi:hypothetical protein
MKSLTKYTIILAMAFTAIGCKKIITEVPYSFLTPENFPRTSSDADAALLGAYSYLQGSSTFRNNLAYMLSTQDDITHPATNFVGQSLGMFQNFQVAGSDLSTQNVWIEMWKGVNACNGLIGTLQGIENEFTWVKAKLAESRALRALYYFYLVRLYGDLPMKLELTSQPVVVQPRVSAEEIYKVIEEDLLAADNKLSNIANGGGRFTNGAVKALLAKVYMTEAGWRRTSAGKMIKGDAKYYTLAKDKAKEVLDLEASGIYAINPDYSTVFKNLSSNVYDKEVILAIEFKMPERGSNFPYTFGAVGGANATKGSGEAYSRANREYVATLDLKDTRVEWNIANYSYSSGWTRTVSNDVNSWGIAKYQKMPGSDYFFNHSTNWPLLKLDDIKLLYAEALNEINNGPTEEAYAQVNALRYRARPTSSKDDGSVLPDLSGLSKDGFLKAIMAERAIELIIEGSRHFDLVRWGILVENVKAASSQTAASFVHDRHYLWPIPPQDLNINGWQQNDGY